MPFIVAAKNADNLRMFSARTLFHPHPDGIPFREPGTCVILIIEGQDGTLSAAHIGPNPLVIFYLDHEHHHSPSG